VTAIRCLLALCSLLLSAWHPEPPDLSAYPWVYLRNNLPLSAAENPVEVVIVGDVLLGRGVSPADDPLADVASWLGAADLAAGNLEGVVVPPGADCSGSAHPDGYQLLMPPSAAAALRDAGFDIVGVANNHVLDCGAAGYAASLAILREAGIEAVGAAESDEALIPPVLRGTRGVRLAWLAFNMVPYPAGFGNLAADVTAARATAAIQAARADADAVIVLVHWGYEYQHRPDPAQPAAARAMLAAGADLVVGHHPHVVQPLAVEDTGGVVAYSLGNFVFDQQFDVTRTGLALRAFFDRNGLRALQALPVHAGPRPRLLSPQAAAPLWARLGLAAPAERRLAFACGGAPASAAESPDHCRPLDVAGTNTVNGGIFTDGAIDLTGDGRAEPVQLRDGRLNVLAPSGSGPVVVWQSEASWRIVDVALGDPNDDGRAELLLVLWKPDADGQPRSHPFIIGYREGIYRTLWGGSAVNRSLREVELGDVDGDGVQELIVLEEEAPGRRTVAVWRWHGWGFSLLWRSPVGRYDDLALATDAGTGLPLVTVAATTLSSPPAGELGP
jgi:poly-gamma-glutamate synthesis protein (capsule biosynthesis protein)